MLKELLIVSLKGSGAFFVLLYLIGVLGAYRRGQLRSASDLALSLDSWGAIVSVTLSMALIFLIGALATFFVFSRKAPEDKVDNDTEGTP